MMTTVPAVSAADTRWYDSNWLDYKDYYPTFKTFWK